MSDLATGSNRATVNVTVDAINDAPVVTAPGSVLNFTEQGSLNIHGTGFSLADVDDNGGTFTATFEVGEGRVLIDAGDSGVTISSGNFYTSGNSTDTVTFSGTKAQLNGLLAGSSTGTIVYYHDQTASSDAPSASTTITLTVNDQGNTGTDPGITGDGSSEAHSAAQTINVTAINDAPNLLGLNLISNGDFATDLTGWTVSGDVQGSFGRASFGSDNLGAINSLAQTIATNSGEIHVLEFDYRDGHASLNQQLEVTVDGASNLLTTEKILTDTDGSSFVRYRYLFTADSASATLTFSDTSDAAGSLSASTLGLAGSLDNVTVRQAGGLPGTASYTEDASAAVLDSDVTLFDAEIDAALDDFNGTTLTLVRNGGANGEDEFSATGLLGTLTEGGNLVYNSVTVGTVTTNSGGTLLLTFNATADNDAVNNVMQAIAYSNSSDTLPASVQIDWTFSDDNTGSQGSGGALTAAGSTTVNVTASNDIVVATDDPVSTNENTPLTFDPRPNDVDEEGDTLAIVDVGNATNGTVVNNGNGTVTYAPNTNYNGSDSFDYVAMDSGAGLQHYWGWMATLLIPLVVLMERSTARPLLQVKSATG